MRRGLLLFAHGARDPRWAEPFNDVARRVRLRDPDLAVQLAFLEMMSPSLREAGQTLVAHGCTRVAVCPLFLGSGGHVRHDLPAQLAELAAAHREVQWSLQQAIGEVDSVIDAIASAAALMAPGAEP